MLRGIGEALSQARLTLVALALALHVTGLLITGERWRVVIAALGTRLRLSRTTLVNLAGIFVRNATPTTGLGGDASRIALLRAEGVPLAQATASFAYVRLAEVPPLVLVVALSTPALASLASRSTTALTIVAVLIGLLLVAAWAARGRLRARLADLWARTKHLLKPMSVRMRQIPALESVLASAAARPSTNEDSPPCAGESLGGLRRSCVTHLRIDRRSMGLAVLYATLAQVETIARQIVIAAAFGVPLTIQQSATVTAMTIAGGFVPTVGSIGAIDGSMVAGLMLFGATAQTAIAITIVSRAISYALTTAAGGAALAWLGGRTLLRAVSGPAAIASDPENSAA